jgi:rod shape-determining protein RodA
LTDKPVWLDRGICLYNLLRFAHSLRFVRARHGKKLRGNMAKVPILLLAPAVGLVFLGWLGIHRAEDLVDGAGRFSRQQLVWDALAAVVLLAAASISYRRLGRFSYLLFALALVLLAAVYALPPINGAHRWIRLGPLGFQPSELAKIAFVLALARYLQCRENYRSLHGLVLPLGISLVPMILILKEPDLGTALVFLPLFFSMMYAAGARSRHLLVLVGVGLMLVPVLWGQMSREQRSRITALLAQTGPGQRPSDDGYQLHQSKQMHALGGLAGSALTSDAVADRAAYHLPEAHTDFVFSVLGERFGLMGAGLVLLLYIVIVWRGLAVAAATREPFGRLVAVGLSTLIGVQALINTGMTAGLLPVTGLSLPLVSYGGSSMLSNAVALGLLINIALRPGYELSKEPFRFQQDS